MRTLLLLLAALASAPSQAAPPDPATSPSCARTATAWVLEVADKAYCRDCGDKASSILEIRSSMLGPESELAVLARGELCHWQARGARDAERALPTCTRAAEELERTLPPDHAVRFVVRSDLAVVHLRLGNWDLARVSSERALAEARRILGPSSQETLEAAVLHAVSLLRADLAAQAVVVLEASLTPWEGQPAPHHAHDVLACARVRSGTTPAR